MPDAPLLALRGLDAVYGDFQALFGISMAVAPGQVVAVTGANGAGESTLLKTSAGLIAARRRDAVAFDGEPIGGLPAHEVVGRGIALVPEGRRLFPSLSVEENLLIGGRTRRAGPWSLDAVYALFPVLAERRHAPSTALSGGQQQMVAVARALINENRLLVIDEPSKGLAPVVVKQVTEALAAIRGTTTILLVEQNLAMARALGDDAVIIDDGRTVWAGPMAEIAADEALQARYLGVGARE